MRFVDELYPSEIAAACEGDSPSGSVFDAQSVYDHDPVDRAYFAAQAAAWRDQRRAGIFIRAVAS